MHLYWAPDGFTRELRAEIAQSPLRLLREQDQFFLCEGSFERLAWSESTWRNCQAVSIESITKAAKRLEGESRFWACRSLTHHRRAQLILDQLPALKNKEISFPEVPALKKFGAFSLVSENELLFSNEVEPFCDPCGPKFKEDQSLPSRAYLKLWESLAFHVPTLPRNEKCLEIGASPGGWTAVLRSLGCETWAVDRSGLSPELMNDPLVHFQKKDAFGIKPADYPQVSWVFSDIISYPEKLYDWVQLWLRDRPDIKMICTIKFQGSTDFEAVQKFKSIPNSRTLHLFSNKHELTWIRA